MRAISASASLAGEVSVSFEILELAEIKSAIDTIHHARFAEAMRIVHQLSEFKVPLFLPLVDHSSGNSHPGVICENTTSGVMLIDGVHRSKAALEAGIDKIEVAVVDRRPGLSPPAKLISLDEIFVGKIPMSRKFQNQLDRSLLRPGEEWVELWQSAFRSECESGQS